jgi:hypothetical protein
MARSKSEFKIRKGKLANLIGLTESEFEELLPFFEISFNNYFEEHTFTGEVRTRAAGKRSDGVFKRPEDALYFLLFYLKTYSTEEVLASTFSMYQPQVNLWKRLLQNIFEICLKEMKVSPSRDAQALNKLLKEMNVKKVIIDATERQIQRPLDNEVQKEYYSGKKSAYGKKHNH